MKSRFDPSSNEPGKERAAIDSWVERSHPTSGVTVDAARDGSLLPVDAKGLRSPTVAPDGASGAQGSRPPPGRFPREEATRALTDLARARGVDVEGDEELEPDPWGLSGVQTCAPRGAR